VAERGGQQGRDVLSLVICGLIQERYARCAVEIFSQDGFLDDGLARLAYVIAAGRSRGGAIT
jgi:hypothetical protein